MMKGDDGMLVRRSQAGKSLTPLLGIVAVLAMGVAAVAIVLQMQEREKRLARERDLQLSLAENESLKSQMDELQQARTKVEGDLGRLRQELARSQEDVTKAVTQQQMLTRSLEEREQEVSQLKQTMEQAQQQAQQATGQVAQLEAERSALQHQLGELEEAKDQLEARFNALAQPEVELGKVVVNGDQPSGASPVRPAGSVAGTSLDGQVVVVNREYDFIVMNIGRNHGLLIGQEFQVVRDNQILGRVKVEKVYDELSAAAILPESQKSSIREGDAVRAL